MGIRVHKVLGYGLTDVKTAKNGKIRDGRINAEALYKAWEIDAKDYLAWIKDKNDSDPSRDFSTDSWLKEEARLFDMGDAIHYDGEYEVLKNGIFPYNASYMNARTGERVKDGISWVQYHWPSFAKYGLDFDKMAKEMGFESEADADENLVPFVPQSVRDIAEFLKLFKKPDVWKQLRPMLYVRILGMR